MAVTLTKVSSSIGNNDAAIAVPNTHTVEIRTSELTIAAAANDEIWAASAFFPVPGSYLSAEPTGNAIVPVFPAHYYKMTGTETPATEYPMTLASNQGLVETQRICNATIAFAVTGAPLRVHMTIRFYFWNCSDILDYPRAVWENRTKYLKNANANYEELDNTVPCIYNTDREIRSWTTVNDATDNVKTSIKIATAYTARFWNKDDYDAAQTVVTNPQFVFTRNGATITDNTLGVYEPTKVQFTGTGSYSVLWFGAFRVSGVNEGIPFIKGTKNCIATPAASNDNPPTALSFSDIEAQLTPLTIGDATCIFDTGNTSGPDYITIDNTKISPLEKWRIYAIIDDGASKLYPFISDELYTPVPGIDIGEEILPAICPPDITSYVTNYMQVFQTAKISVTGMQRLLLRLDACNGGYCAATPFVDGLSRVDVTFYYEGPKAGGGTLQHIVAQYYAVKAVNNLTNTVIWVGNGELTITEVGSDCLTFELPVRLRYEPDILNIMSVDATTGQPMFAPLGNQDWNGKTIYAKWKFTVNQTSPTVYQDTIIFPQVLIVKPLDTTVITMEAVDENGDPITQLCSGDEICVHATKNDVGDDYILWLLENEPYVAEVVEEEESFAGQLVQLSQVWPESPVPSQFASDEATACIKKERLTIGVEHRMSLIKFKYPADLSCGLEILGYTNGEYVALPDNFYLDGGSPRNGSFWGFECWLKILSIPQGTPAAAAVFAYRPDGTACGGYTGVGPGVSFGYQEQGGQIYIGGNFGDVQVTDAVFVAPPYDPADIIGKWVHVIWQMADTDDPADAKVWINGQPTVISSLGIAQNNYDIDANSNPYIGIDGLCPAGTADQQDFQISGARIWATELDDDNAQSLYLAGRCFDASGVVFATLHSQLLLDETSGTTAAETENTNNGTLTNYAAGRVLAGGGAWLNQP